jgi:hypothetical protein
MKLPTNVLAVLVTALALAVAAPWAFAGTDSDGPTAAQLEAARTPADHAAIAQAYEDEAAALERKADAHEAMAKIYRSGGAPKAGSPAMTSHCERLVKEYRGAAQSARSLAAEHRALAGKTG